MDNKNAIKKLDTIIAMADSLKSTATGLRKDLGYVYTPAPKRGKGLSAEASAKVLARRRKYINNNINKGKS